MLKQLTTFCIISLVSISTSIPLFAQNKSMGQSDPNAKKVLDQVSANFKKYKAVKASFVFKNEDAKGKVLGVKKGSLFMKGAKYRITLSGGQDIFCDGVNIWTYDPSANEVTIAKFDPAQNTITPQKLFTNFYDKDFLYRLNADKTESGKQLHEVELTPFDKSKSFFKVYLLVDKATKTIYSTKIMEKSGVHYIYTVSALNGNAPVTDDVFVFDQKKYPGVELVDLR
ncbi:MAG: LolA family protein [Bacteroidota bacterium]|jgi:outer membrane lipoprotein carrier protein